MKIRPVGAELFHANGGIDGQTDTTKISGFRRDVDEICGLLGYYTASCGKHLPHDAV
jgi:hypothetical protein